MLHRSSRRWLVSAIAIVSLFGYFVPLAAPVEVPFEYDANGNLISGEGKYYEYNDANQLVRVRQGNATGQVLEECSYDFDGRRVKKIEDRFTTYYPGKHFESQARPGESADTSYYFADRDRVAKMDSAGRTFFFFLDHLGSTDAVQASSGTDVWRTRYYPFGEVRLGRHEGYSYNGKALDAPSSAYYFEARYYRPDLAHFSQADAIVPDPYNPQALNRYSYAFNNPMAYRDPSGHSSQKQHRMSNEMYVQHLVDKGYIKESQSEKVLRYLNEGTYAADNDDKYKNYNPAHALRDPGMSKGEAERLWNQFIEAHLILFRNFLDFDMAKAYFELGLALHAMQDHLALAHKNFAEFNAGTRVSAWGAVTWGALNGKEDYLGHADEGTTYDRTPVLNADDVDSRLAKTGVVFTVDDY
jgi:RHS repeat-associated protein